MGGAAAGMMMGGGLGGGVAPPPPMTMGAGGGGTPMGDLESFQRMHNLDDGALKLIYKKFLEADKDGTGLVDINAFCNLLQVPPSFSTVTSFFLSEGSARKWMILAGRGC